MVVRWIAVIGVEIACAAKLAPHVGFTVQIHTKWIPEFIDVVVSEIIGIVTAPGSSPDELVTGGDFGQEDVRGAV